MKARSYSWFHKKMTQMMPVYQTMMWVRTSTKIKEDTICLYDNVYFFSYDAAEAAELETSLTSIDRASSTTSINAPPHSEACFSFELGFNVRSPQTTLTTGAHHGIRTQILLIGNLVRRPQFHFILIELGSNRRPTIELSSLCGIQTIPETSYS